MPVARNGGHHEAAMGSKGDDLEDHRRRLSLPSANGIFLPAASPVSSGCALFERPFLETRSTAR
jgi:hypothetical protein